MAKSKLEDQFALQIEVRNLPAPVRQLKFGPHRGPKGHLAHWYFDFAWPEYMIAVEIQGGTWSGGAHGRGSGIQRNFKKANAAAILGWWILQGDGRMVNNCTLVEDLVEAIMSTTPSELAGGRTPT